MTLDDQAEALAIALEQGYLDGGLPRMIGLLLAVWRGLKGTNGREG